MTLQHHELYAQKIIEQYLPEWSFSWDRALLRYGCCNYGKKRISASKPLFEADPNWDRFSDTIKHEIAHGISEERYGTAGYGHGRLWKKVCVEIGARPVRCGKKFSENQQKTYRDSANWTFSCGCCSQESSRIRRPKRGSTYFCIVCYNNGLGHQVLTLTKSS